VTRWEGHRHHVGKTVSLGRYATHEFAAKALRSTSPSVAAAVVCRNHDVRLQSHAGAVASCLREPSHAGMVRDLRRDCARNPEG
jgi:hypothetical protein